MSKWSGKKPYWGPPHRCEMERSNKGWQGEERHSVKSKTYRCKYCNNKIVITKLEE